MGNGVKVCSLGGGWAEFDVINCGLLAGIADAPVCCEGSS
jgi:hypothetical protein